MDEENNIDQNIDFAETYLEGIDPFIGKNVYRKAVDFRGSFKLPVFATDPLKCEIGELVVVGTTVKVCTATTPTWVVVGTQT